MQQAEDKEACDIVSGVSSKRDIGEGVEGSAGTRLGSDDAYTGSWETDPVTMAQEQIMLLSLGMYHVYICILVYLYTYIIYI